MVRRHGETCAINEEVSTSNNTQDKDIEIQDFFQPLLSDNSARSKVITTSIAHFIAKDY